MRSLNGNAPNLALAKFQPYSLICLMPVLLHCIQLITDKANETNWLKFSSNIIFQENLQS